MPKDALQQYAALKASLLNEKKRIEQRLVAINQALGEAGHVAPPTTPKATRKVLKRVKNQVSLKEAIIKVTSAAPKTKPEILEGIKALGYRFATKNPMNSINVILYGRKPKFKNRKGKFSPMK